MATPSKKPVSMTTPLKRQKQKSAEKVSQRDSKPDFQELIDSEEYTLRKRLPPKLPKRKNDVYVSRKTAFKVQLERCQKLLESGHPEIYIHGLGAAIDRAINLALTLKQQSLECLNIGVNTSTVELLDDLDTERDDLDPEVRSRLNSAVHIRVFRTAEENQG